MLNYQENQYVVPIIAVPNYPKQEQFFHLFNDLFQKGKQIVLTTDCHPSKLKGLKERLVSRFQSGLIVDIQPPDLETRIAILMKKSDDDSLEIPYNVTEFIAQAIKGDIRAMEGALVKLLALSSLKKEDITMDLAKQVLRNLLGSNSFLDIIGCYNNFQDAISVVNGHIEYKIMGPYHLQKKID